MKHSPLTFLLLALASFPMPARADEFLYVSLAPEQKIQILHRVPGGGKLESVDAVSVEGAPGSLAVDSKRNRLFASLRSNSTIAAFRIDPATGKLTLMNSAPLGKDENAAFVAVDPTGRWLLSASYAAGKVVVHKLKDDGSIESPALQTISTEKTAHCVAFDRAGRFAFVPHVAPNAVFQFRFDPATGKLSDETRAAGGAAKAGPRHLAFHPTLDMAFTSDESGSSITAYRHDAEKGLSPVQTLSTLPENWQGSNSTAEVKVHPNGKFVWVSNRGHDSLAGFAIDAAGKLSAIGQTPTEKTPRSFAIAPDGRKAYGAGEGSGRLAEYDIDLESGRLTRSGTLELGKSLTWVAAVKLGE